MKPEPTSVDPVARTRLRLLDLAEDASLYLRRSAQPSVRVAAALLLAASLAACSSSDSSTTGPVVPPLTEEVKQGLPSAMGTYAVSPTSLARDAQGVYGFDWRNQGSTDAWSAGRSSLMKLAQGTSDTLEVPQSGDPILRLRPETAINLPDDPDPIAPTPTPGGTSSASTSSGNRSSILWYPFPSGGTTTSTTGTGSTGTVAPTTPAYRNPPAADPGQGSVRGSSSSSLTADSAPARTWVSPARAAATGQSGGPGRGTAISSRAGVASGAARPGSSGFSGGKSGSSSGSSSG